MELYSLLWPKKHERRIMNEKFLTIKEVVDLVGFKKSTIYKFIKEGKFPEPVKIGISSRWKLSSIQKWMETLASRN